MYNCRSSDLQSCGNILKSDFSVFCKSTCVPYLSPTTPAKARSDAAPRGNISDHRWLQAYNAIRCHGNLTPMWFSQSRPHCDVCGWAEVSLSLCIYHGGSAATPIFGAALIRSDVNSFLGLKFQLIGFRLSVVLVLYEFSVLSWRSAPVALTLRLCRGKYLKYCY